MIINGQRYEAEPAVEAYVKDLQAENEEQRREILRLTDELKDIEIACYDAAMAREKLKAENARLEEGYQKSVGVIAATDCVKCKDKEYINDVNYAISYIRDFCKDRKCKTCPISIDGRCSLGGLTPKGWENSIKALDEEIYGTKMDGGADNAK